MSPITIKANGSAAITPASLEDFDPERMLSEGETKTARIVTSDEPTVQFTAGILPPEERYASSDAISRAFGTALKLLREAESHAERAAAAAEEGDRLGADDAIYTIKPLLPELFCCRQLGDGFGLVVSGLMSAFQNLAGQPMSIDQMRVVLGCIKTLRAAPRISLDSADVQIDSLEEVGLNPDPRGIEDLVGAITPDEETTSK